MRQSAIFIFASTLFLTGPLSCAKRGCEGPELDVERLNALRGSEPTSKGPNAFLVLPNPIDATQLPQATISDTRTLQAGDLLSLMGLLNPKRLENNFLKVRIKSTTDALSTLATPNSSGEFKFQPKDVHYSETMAYHSVTSIQSYVEALGFSVVKSRPLYVMVQASGGATGEINAFYDHGYLNPSAPRTIKLYGTGQFAPGVDRDMYWHEFGHLFNESITREVGMDYAGDMGAAYSEGAALHECLADYLAESVGNKDYIGKWIARNFDEFEPGEPLRSAVDLTTRLDFSSVSSSTTTDVPQRYRVAEWCTRVLWDIREKFVEQNQQAGPIQADRMIFSAATLLKKDTSLAEFEQALMTADEELHCGGFTSDIQNAFSSRGFSQGVPLNQALVFSGQAVGLRSTTSGFQTTSLTPGGKFGFTFTLQNPNGQTARNVRVKIEPLDSRVIALSYQQSYGDLVSGKTLRVGLSGGLPLDYTVHGEIDSRAARGQRLPYRIRILTENGKELVFNGELRL